MCRCGDEGCRLPDPRQFECPECEKRWATQSAAEDCCGDWLGYD